MPDCSSECSERSADGNNNDDNDDDNDDDDDVNFSEHVGEILKRHFEGWHGHPI